MARGIIFCGAWIRLWIRSAASTYNSREYVSIRDHPGPRVKSLPAAAHSSITLVYHSRGRWEKEKRSPGEHTRLSRLVLRFLMDNLRYFDLPVFDPTLRFSFFTRWQCDGQVYHSMATFHGEVYEVDVFSVKEVLFCFNGYSESSELSYFLSILKVENNRQIFWRSSSFLMWILCFFWDTIGIFYLWYKGCEKCIVGSEWKKYFIIANDMIFR